MKKIVVVITCSALMQGFSQGGWLKDSNPLNAVVSYTTNYPYIGASFIELNGDNYVDLHVAPRTIYLNNGDGTFQPKTLLPFYEMVGVSGSSAADIDNDGDNDLVIACTPSRIFLNNGNGTFSNGSPQVPGFTNYGAWASAIGDFNKDSYLDFIFAHADGFHPPSPSSPCRLYSQTNSFNPVLKTGYPFTDTLSSYTNPFWSDYDLDGDMDLFIASGPAGTPGPDYCYKNMKMEWGADTLVKMSTELFASQQQDGQCYNFIDYDNDLDFDLCITNYFGAPTRFYRNTGNGYQLLNTPFSNTTSNLANCWGDYDNDGDQDVIITNDNQPARYYRNNGNSTFTFLSNGFTTPTGVCSASNGDYDNDGDLDIFISGVGSNGNSTSVGLYINDTVSNNRNFVNLQLVGTQSNRSSIGAIVRIKATIYGSTFWQMREVNAQNTFQGQNDLRVHFGLGDAANIDSIAVTWPSGQVDHYVSYAANTFYKLTETDITTGTKSYEIKSAVDIYPNPSHDYITIRINQPQDLAFHYCLSDLNGNIKSEGLLLKEYTRLNLTALPQGVFILHVTREDAILVKKIIKVN